MFLWRTVHFHIRWPRLQILGHPSTTLSVPKINHSGREFQLWTYDRPNINSQPLLIIEAAQMTGMEPFSSGFSFGVYQYLDPIWNYMKLIGMVG